MKGASARISRFQVLAMRAADEFRRHGLRSLARRGYRFIDARIRPRGPATERRPAALVPLALQRGDWVEVRTADEIRATLDDTGRNRGLGFMPGMFAFCGQRLQVYKRAETIVLEGTGETRKLKDTVLLQGAICDGEGFVCDRSCFYFWKEAWLKRV